MGEEGEEQMKGEETDWKLKWQRG